MTNRTIEVKRHFAAQRHAFQTTAYDCRQASSYIQSTTKWQITLSKKAITQSRAIQFMMLSKYMQLTTNIII